MGNKVLVGGSGGFLGTNFLNQLQDRNISYKELDQNMFYHPSQWGEHQDCDTFVNLAAHVGGFIYNKANPFNMFHKNNQIITNTVEWLLQNKHIKHCIMPGSVCSYRFGPGKQITKENIFDELPNENNQSYGMAKRLVAYYSKLLNQSNIIKFECPVLTNMYGPYDNFSIQRGHVIPTIINKIHQAKINNFDSIRLFGNGLAQRQFAYVKDVALLLVDMLGSGKKYEPYFNIIPDRPITIHRLTEIISDIIGYRCRIFFDSLQYMGDDRKLAQDAGNFTSLVDGVEETYKWYRENIVNDR